MAMRRAVAAAITRVGTTQRWSDVVIHNGTLYAVEVPATEDADIHQQTREVLGSLQRLLEANGSGVDKILMANIYLKDIADIAAFNEQWDAWIPAGTAPVRACVQARLAHEGLKVCCTHALTNARTHTDRLSVTRKHSTDIDTYTDTDTCTSARTS